MSDSAIDELRARMADVNVLVGVSGSIAAVGAPHLLGWLRMQLGVRNVQVVMTDMANYIVDRRTVMAVTDGPVIGGWDDAPGHAAPHVQLAQWADVIVVMPATANLLGKLANGIADNLLLSTLLAASCPVVLVPAMNDEMWQKPAVQRNVAQLGEDGYRVFSPGAGITVATGEPAMGAMADYREVFRAALVFALADDGAVRGTAAEP